MGEPLNYDGYAAKYRRNRWAVPWIFEPLLEAVRELPTGTRVVELGCGTGNYVIALSEARSDVSYFGFDVSEGMLEQARSRGAAVQLTLGNADSQIASLMEITRKRIQGQLEIDDDFVGKLNDKCASSLRLIDDESHRRGIERVRAAAQRRETWQSRYTMLRFDRT